MVQPTHPQLGVEVELPHDDVVRVVLLCMMGLIEDQQVDVAHLHAHKKATLVLEFMLCQAGNSCGMVQQIENHTLDHLKLALVTLEDT